MHAKGNRHGVKGEGGEILEMIVAYAKQETLDPLKGLGRYLAFGLAGSVAVAAGSVLVILAALRVLQTETGSVFAGNLVWLPYVITAPIAVAVIGVLAGAVARGMKRGGDRS